MEAPASTTRRARAGPAAGRGPRRGRSRRIAAVGCRVRTRRAHVRRRTITWYPDREQQLRAVHDVAAGRRQAVRQHERRRGGDGIAGGLDGELDAGRLSRRTTASSANRLATQTGPDLELRAYARDHLVGHLGGGGVAADVGCPDARRGRLEQRLVTARDAAAAAGIAIARLAMYRSSAPAARIIAIGLAMFLPSSAGAVPCGASVITSRRTVVLVESEQHRLGARRSSRTEPGPARTGGRRRGSGPGSRAARRRRHRRAVRHR